MTLFVLIILRPLVSNSLVNAVFGVITAFVFFFQYSTTIRSNFLFLLTWRGLLTMFIEI